MKTMGSVYCTCKQYVKNYADFRGEISEKIAY